MALKKRERGAPAAGGGSFEAVDLGEPSYHTPVGPARTVVRLVPVDAVAVTDAGEPRTGQRSKASVGQPLIPSSEETAALPKLAREAFVARCTARVAPLSDTVTPEAVAALLLAAATVDTPIRRQLLCLRRDFDRLARLAKAGAWTDDTPVPPDAFGPLWPNGLAPTWAKEAP